jgi:CheY-like chemotaxis protein
MFNDEIDSDLDKKYILSVDDDAINQQLIRSLLKDDYNSVSVESGNDCLESVGQKMPDLILLDISFPDGMNGIEICEKLRANPQTVDTPIIFVSAKTEAKEHLEAYEAGGDDFLNKPFVKEELLHKIKLLLKNQEKKIFLKQSSESNISMLMTTLTNTGELGNIIAFIRESYECHSIEVLVNNVFNTFTHYGLQGTMMLKLADETNYYFSDGLEKDIEKQILSHIHNTKERIVSFGKGRVSFNSDASTMLVKNMPDDDDKTGRFRDHLLMLLDAFNSRLVGVKREVDAVNKEKALSEFLQDAQAKLKNITENRKSQRESNSASFSKMNKSFDDTIMFLGLDSEQEEAFKKCLSQAEGDINNINLAGIVLDKEFDKTMMELFLLSFQN